MRRYGISRGLAVAAALGAMLAVLPGSIPSTPATAQAYAVVGDCRPGDDWGTLRQDLTQRVIDLVNQHRARLGLAQLQASTPLTNSAVWKSRHMARYQYMAHNDPAPPVARGVGDRLLACGYPANSAGWGENIAYGYATADAVMQAWLNSPGHRSNIENPSFRAIGVGAAASTAGRLYWTQQFGTTAGGSGSPPAPAPPPPAPAPPPPAPAPPPPAPAPPPPAPAPPTGSYACSNGKDDDGDGKVDYPADRGCSSPTDTNEFDFMRRL
jgi:uncharacterized protein YkwD